MKIYISADMEGVTGLTHIQEINKDKKDYEEFREQMTAEVVAACQGAIAAGAEEIFVKDAHSSGRNIIGSRLPRCVRIIRGWAGHPYGMMQGLDNTFDGVLMIGYHSAAGSQHSPLSHTFTDTVYQIRLNGKPASEFLLNCFTAALEGVPVLFVSGDEGICEEARSVHPQIKTVAVKRGDGNSTVSIHHQLAVEKIENTVKEALLGNIPAARIKLPENFRVEMEFISHCNTQKASFYPGVQRRDARSIYFESENYFEVLRLFLFII
ncbi:MAG: M55 family metallopeptidase [Calditrichia bacterium]